MHIIIIITNLKKERKKKRDPNQFSPLIKLLKKHTNKQTVGNFVLHDLLNQNNNNNKWSFLAFSPLFHKQFG